MSCKMRAPDGVTKPEMLQALWACTQPKPFCLMLGPKGEVLGYADEYYSDVRAEIRDKLKWSERIGTVGCRKLDVDLSKFPEVQLRNCRRISDAFKRCVRDQLNRS